jgi:hypothetical protein
MNGGDRAISPYGPTNPPLAPADRGSLAEARGDQATSTVADRVGEVGSGARRAHSVKSAFLHGSSAA